MWIQVIESPLGDLSAYWSELGISRLSFGRVDQAVAHVGSSSTGSAAGARALASSLAEYFDGGELEFPLAHIDWTGTPDFHRRVLGLCAQIARGQTMTYGALAVSAGSPGAARAVGQAMARNRWPLIIPCHRVLGHSGRLTGYSGSGGTDTKRALLDFEAGGSPLASALATERAFAGRSMPSIENKEPGCDATILLGSCSGDVGCSRESRRRELG